MGGREWPFLEWGLEVALRAGTTAVGLGSRRPELVHCCRGSAHSRAPALARHSARCGGPTAAHPRLGGPVGGQRILWARGAWEAASRARDLGPGGWGRGAKRVFWGMEAGGPRGPLCCSGQHAWSRPGLTGGALWEASEGLILGAPGPPGSGRLRLADPSGGALELPRRVVGVPRTRTRDHSCHPSAPLQTLRFIKTAFQSSHCVK